MIGTELSDTYKTKKTNFRMHDKMMASKFIQIKKEARLAR